MTIVVMLFLLTKLLTTLLVTEAFTSGNHYDKSYGVPRCGPSDDNKIVIILMLNKINHV